MATNAKNQELKAAEDKYYRDRATLMKLFGARPLDCEWLIERKYGAYVATECWSGFQVYGKSMREIIDALRLAKVKITPQVKFINHDQAERWNGARCRVQGARCRVQGARCRVQGGKVE